MTETKLPNLPNMRLSEGASLFGIVKMPEMICPELGRINAIGHEEDVIKFCGDLLKMGAWFYD